MNQIWAPWRMEYLENDHQEGCIFCPGSEKVNDRDRLILYRTPFSFVMMNRYPYTNGHLLISPYRHTSDMNLLSGEEMLDLFETLRHSRNVLEKALAPQGFNIGVNLGKSAGAGVTEHMHIHIVPRWNGDSNFMSVVSETRVIPEHLQTTYAKLLPHFDSVAEGSRF